MPVISAIIIGMAGVVFISFFTYWFNIFVHYGMPQPVIFSLTPIAFFLIFIAILLINPLLRLLCPSLGMRKRELATVLCMWLFAGAICYVSLIIPLIAHIGNVTNPALHNQTIREAGIVDYIRPELFLPEEATRDFYYGMTLDGVSRIRPFARSTRLKGEDLRDLDGLASKIIQGDDPLSAHIRGYISPELFSALEEVVSAASLAETVLLEELNAVIAGPMLFDEETAEDPALSERLKREIELHLRAPEVDADEAERLNRLLLEEVFPVELMRHSDDMPARLASDDLRNMFLLAERIREMDTPWTTYLFQRFSAPSIEIIESYTIQARETLPKLINEINELLEEDCLLNFIPADRRRLSDPGRTLINRLMIENAFPEEIAASPEPVRWPFEERDIRDVESLALRIHRASDPLSAFIRQTIENDSDKIDRLERLAALSEMPAADYADAEHEKLADEMSPIMLEALNAALRRPGLYTPERFTDVDIPEKQLRLINRTVLHDHYSNEIASLPPHVPWRLWIRPLSYWVPLMLLIVLLPYSLVRMMHRQWSKNELLVFPIADIADGLVTCERKRVLPDIFYRTNFWIGFAMVAFVYLINGLSRWYPLMVSIPLEFEHRDMVREFHFLANYCGSEAYALFRGWLWPMVIGIAVLLPTDVSLTCWLGYVLMIFAMGFYFLFTGDIVNRGDQQAIHVGMFIAMFAVIIFIGRREYWRTLKLAFTSRASKTPELAAAIKGCRYFIFSFAALILMLNYAGLNWLISLILVSLFTLVVILLARITAEAGFPWANIFSGTRTPTAMTSDFLGSAAIGPPALALMAIVGISLNLDTSNTIAAQTTTFDKLEENVTGGKSSKIMNAGLLAAVLMTMAATIFFALWSHYSFGAQVDGGSRGRTVGALDSAATRINRLRIEGLADRLTDMGPLERLSHVQFEGRFWLFFAYGAGAILICSLMRLRFARWPIHPLPLLLANTWAMSRLYHSYFLGWIIKMALVRIGGGDFYHRTKPFFIGMIMGQIIMGGFWIAVGSIYYWQTGMRPPYWRYFA